MCRTRIAPAKAIGAWLCSNGCLFHGMQRDHSRKRRRCQTGTRRGVAFGRTIGSWYDPGCMAGGYLETSFFSACVNTRTSAKSVATRRGRQRTAPGRRRMSLRRRRIGRGRQRDRAGRRGTGAGRWITVRIHSSPAGRAFVARGLEPLENGPTLLFSSLLFSSLLFPPGGRTGPSR